VRKAHNLTTFMRRFPWNLGTSNSWKPRGVCRDCFTFTQLNKLIHSNKLRPSSEIRSSSVGQEAHYLNSAHNLAIYLSSILILFFTHTSVCPKQSIVWTSHFPWNLSFRLISGEEYKMCSLLSQGDSWCHWRNNT